jgi:hypothetical protein
MPCYSPPENERIVYRPSPEDRRDIDTITRLACDHCKALEAQGIAVPEWAAGWWAEHKRWDRVREEREAEKERRREILVGLFARMTQEERDALVGWKP